IAAIRVHLSAKASQSSHLASEAGMRQAKTVLVHSCAVHLWRAGERSTSKVRPALTRGRLFQRHDTPRVAPSRHLLPRQAQDFLVPGVENVAIVEKRVTEQLNLTVCVMDRRGNDCCPRITLSPDYMRSHAIAKHLRREPVPGEALEDRV